MIELVEKRQRNSKTFRLDNGVKRLVVGMRDIHYKDQADQWQDIDFSYHASQQTGYAWENGANDFKVYFKNKKLKILWLIYPLN